VNILAPDGALSYTWSNGETTREIIVEDSGWYKVTMEGTAGGGCFAQDSAYVGYYPEPTASFNADTSCINEFKIFSDLSTSVRTIDQWSWDFDNDGNEDSNLQNPNYQFSQSGLFPVELWVTTVNNCIDDTIIDVLVSDPPDPDFRYTRTCDGDSLALINQSDTQNIGFEWRYNNVPFSSDIHTKYLFNAARDYNIELWLTNEFGCKDSVIETVTVNPNPDADFDYTPVCFPNTTQFTNTSTISTGTISTYDWDFQVDQSQQENPMVDFDSSGVYDVQLIITSDSGCIDTIQKAVEHYDLPIAKFSSDTACFTFETQLLSLSSSKDSIVGWDWDFNTIIDDNSENPVNIFPITGMQPVRLSVTTNKGCSNDTIQMVYVAELPEPDFIVNSSCAYDSVLFTNLSDPSNDFLWIHDIDNYQVNDNQFNSSKLFDNYGTYTTRLIAQNNFGCLDSVDSTFQVHPVPEASFDYTEVCFPFETNFQSTSSIAQGSVNFHRWKYGNGNVDTDIANTSQFYQSSGEYDVQLYIESNFGCKDSITQRIEHFEKPVANFTVGDFCRYDSVTVTNNSATLNDAITQHEWSTINQTDQRFEPKFKYDSFGEKIISLVVTTENNCKDTITDTTYIHAIPEADFEFENVCAFTEWSGTNSSNILDGILQSYRWEIDNNTWNSQDITNSFDEEGDYEVELIATSNFGCIDTITKTITIYPLPLVTFEITNSCTPEPVQIKALSSVSNGPTNIIASNNWDMGNGDQRFGDEIAYQYPDFGDYDIKLVSVTNNGCSDSTEQTATVHPKPIANFGSDMQEGCSEWCVELFDLSTIASGRISNREWVLEDIENTSDSITVSCFYNDTEIPQNYDIRLIVESDKGCTDEIVSQDYITVYPNAVADFDYQPYDLTENNSGAYFQNWSRSADDYTWFMGDSTILREFEPYHEYQESGDYLVTLIANNEFNCPDTVSKPLEVDPVYSYFIPNTFTPNDDGINEEFFVKSYNIVYIELYIFNRWGDLIYQEEGASPRWDGTLNGNIVQIDTYVYKAFLTDIFNKRHEVVGHVNVIR
jgi:gliding motility-associated-like protein